VINDDKQERKSLRTAKIFQTLFLVAILIYVDLLLRIKVPPPYSLNTNTLKWIIIIFAILGVFSLIYGNYLQKWMIKGYKPKVQPKINQFLLSVIIVRATMFEATAIWGLVLSILGASMLIVALFFVAAFADLIVTFPTQARWNKMKAGISGYQDQ
jgi:hypothetical protein